MWEAAKSFGSVQVEMDQETLLQMKSQQKCVVFFKGISRRCHEFRFRNLYTQIGVYSMVEYSFGILRGCVDGFCMEQRKVTSGKLAWQWNIAIFKRTYIFKGSICHCYVSLEGNKDIQPDLAVTEIGRYPIHRLW